MSWTAEKEKKLKELWTKGHTASQIAGLLGETTRNAVIGKAHRLNLEARAVSRRTLSNKTNNNIEQSSSPDIKNKKLGRKAKFQALLLDKSFEPENPKTLEELTDETCKWPIGHPEEASFYFCGRSSLKDFSYCKLHLLYAYQPKGRKEEPESDKVGDAPQYIEKKANTA